MHGKPRCLYQHQWNSLHRFRKTTRWTCGCISARVWARRELLAGALHVVDQEVAKDGRKGPQSGMEGDLEILAELLQNDEMQKLLPATAKI